MIKTLSSPLSYNIYQSIYGFNCASLRGFLCVESGEWYLSKKELSEFLIQRCKEKGLSLRGLSINAGLSPATVHNIIKREYEPTLFTLNRLADYLGVKRPYLWQMAGLLKDMDYDEETILGDPRLRFHFAQADKLSESARKLVISNVAAIIAYVEREGEFGGSKGCPSN